MVIPDTIATMVFMLWPTPTLTDAAGGLKLPVDSPEFRGASTAFGRASG